MTLSCPRIALLTGVSLVAVGLAAPANAATTISPGIGHIDTSDPVEDLLIICDLAPGDPTSPCEYGVEASGAGVVEAIVDDVASGRIEQIGSSISGDVDLHIVSDGKAAIVAHATASEADGLARANAVISDAIYQEGAGLAEITIDLSNDGELLIEAIANAAGGEDGAAHALAVIDAAILQTADATAGGSASVALTNDGDIRFAATAVATGSATGATESGASVSGMARVYGISQGAVARDVATSSRTTSEGNFVIIGSDIPTGPVALSLTNSGDLGMAANASAQATEFALARATVDAVRQRAEGADAGITLTNVGGIDIGASASASGSDYALAGAFADGFHQTATAMGTVVQSGFTPLGGFTHEFARLPYGDASVELENSGEIEITAVAHAVAAASDADAATGVGAVAGAYVFGVRQSAAGHDASAMFSNSGSLAADASAVATGEDQAAAQVHVAGVFQAALATGFTSNYEFGPSGTPISFDYATHWLGYASLGIENSGTIEISARAEALAGGPAQIDATALGIWQATRGLESRLTVDNSGNFEVSAVGQATATLADVVVLAGGFIQQGAVGYDQASVEMSNTGELEASASALANGEIAVVSAVALGASQAAEAIGDASETLVNSGDLSVSVIAAANAESIAELAALAIGAQQQASAGAVGLGMENSGTLSADVEVAVAADAESGFAFASAGALGMNQLATGYQVTASMTNSGSLNADVDIAAVADATAAALASAIGALQQAAGSDLHLSFENSGLLTVDASLSIEAGDSAYGNLGAFGVLQSAEGASGGMSIANSGTVDVGLTADVKATGGDANAILLAGAVGAVQLAVGDLLKVENHGEINAVVDLNATVDAEAGFAYASGGATGVGQFAFGEFAKLALINDGTIDANAHAVASATTAAGISWAWAKAFGVNQSNGATTAFLAFDNSGHIDAEAMATATSLARRATALAIGYKAIGGEEPSAIVAVNNSGAISVAASADAAGSAADLVEIATPTGPFDAGSAVADAVGIFMALPAGSNADPNVGTLTNAGSIDVVAKAAGETMTTVFESGSFVTTVTVGRSSAFAAGIRLTGGYNGMTVTNSGTINVDAITFDDGFAQAIGIAALASVFMDRRPDVILTINNMGDIVARESIDGGQTWRRGLAINVAGNPENFAPGLPNKAVINLLGGNIYGNIAIQQGDVINVQRAETAFDGIINPVCMGTSFAVDGGGGPCGVGTLFINDGGTLFLQDPRSAARSNMYDGPSYAFVDTLDMRAGPDGATGTIAFGLQPTNRGSQPAGTYTQLFANTAILDGTLEVRFSPTGRTSANSYFWDNVIDADSRTGTFDNCVIGGAYGRSVLLGKLTCVYDDANNVDLSLARVAFDKVHGMGRNAITVGAYLERIHGSATTGGTANLLADLFLIDDEKKYDQALSSLGGAGYANYLQSFVSLGLRHNDLAEAATHCGGAGLYCRGFQPIRIWGMVDDQRSGARGGVESGIAHYTSTVLGADIRVGSAAMVGFSAGKVGNGVRQSISSETMEAEGFQVGGYAALDPGPYYARGVITLSRFEGSSARNLNLASLGGTFAGAMSGDPDVKMRTLGLHAGARIDVGHGLLVNPYVNLDHVHAALGGFTEGTGFGSNAAELKVQGGNVSAAFAGAGAKLSTRIGAFLTEADFGYRYRLGDRRSSVTAAFRNSKSDAFQIVSDAEERGTFLAGFSLGGRLGRAELKMSYAGEFNGNSALHRGDFSITLPLGRPSEPRPNPAVDR